MAMKMKNNLRRISCLLLAMLLAGALTPQAMASDREKRRARHEMHLLHLQLAAMQQQKDALAAQAGDLKKKLDDLQAKYAALEKKSRGQRERIDDLATQNRDTDKKLQDMTEQNDETGKTLEQTRAAKQQVEASLQSCTNKNSELYKLSVKLMHKYQSKDAVDSLLQREPFTGLEQVRIENLLQDYQDKADANKVETAGNATQEPRQP